jgi:hypothetical protein
MFLSSWSRLVTSQSLFPLLVALVGMGGMAGCEDKHVGRPCDIGLSDPTDPKLISVNPQALECPSRVCIWPAQDKSTDTKALCTVDCSSDDDCADGEKRDSDTNPFGCRTGFACRRILPLIESNPLSCKPICVCRDFLVTDDPNMKPPTCP